MKTNQSILLGLILFFMMMSCKHNKEADRIIQEQVETVINNSPGAGNPVLPGYYADPTIKKFGDTYYIYATTDNEMLASGAPTVWYSKDLQNWYNYTMEIPSLSSVNLRNYWAPDIIAGDDGKYYLYFGNCQAGCNIYGYVSDSPIGPWEKLNADDTPVIAHNYPNPGFPSLDAQFFKDDDGKIYAYWGTWVHYNNGYAVGELNADTMKDMMNSKQIPLEQTPEPFEAAYMMKKGDTYILMYSGASCHDETYNVRYSYADNPYGPFTPGANNPILSTNEDMTVHGPGHHSVLQEDDKAYIVYHRHDYPMTRGGLSRQVCIDEMIFENDSTIKKVIPSHKGVDFGLESQVPENMAFQAKTSASSSYHLKSPEYDYEYGAHYATDDNNATMWKAADNTFPQNVIIDLEEVKPVKRVMTQFEFASYYYQYIIEYSVDGNTWQMYADKSENRTSGSPVIDDSSVEARYLKLTILGTEKNGLLAAVWNVKVYSSLFDIPLQLTNKPSRAEPAKPASKTKLVDVNSKVLQAGEQLAELANAGSLGGVFKKVGDVAVVKDSETNATVIDFRKGALVLDQPVPKSLSWNGAFTVSAWVKNPDIAKEGEFLASWCNRQELNLALSYNALVYNSSHYGAASHLDGHFDMAYKQLPEANKWHHIVLTFDGVVEKIYVDGVLDNSQNMLLSSVTRNAKIIIGASDVGEHFSGQMSSLQMYDFALEEADIKTVMQSTKP